MKRADAVAMLGTRVSAWTSSNGVYVGVLKEVLDRRPWRAVVEVDGVLEPACCFERRPLGGHVFRRGKRVGDLIEVGGVNVEPTEATGTADYLSLLESQAASMEAEWEEGRSGPLAHSRRLAHLPSSAAAVRAAVVRLRVEALPLSERVGVEEGADRLAFRLPAGSDRTLAAIDAALASLHEATPPGPAKGRWPPRATWAHEEREWVVTPSRIEGDVLAAVAERLVDEGDEVSAALLAALTRTTPRP